MSTDEPQNELRIKTSDDPKSPTERTEAPTPTERRRPRLDLSAALGTERKRGKSMFGLVVGTLKKASIEDKERNASEAAKKRQLIEQRLQAKLRKETDSVRRAEEARKEKTTATRKEEDLQLKDSIYKLRRRRLPLLSNFLLTSDVIPSDDSTPPSNPLAPPPRTHPPPLYYLPAILTPSQQAFIDLRKAEVKEAAEREWEAFREERKAGIEEIDTMRRHVADEEANLKKVQTTDAVDMDTDTARPEPAVEPPPVAPTATETNDSEKKDVDMEVDEPPAIQKEDSKGSSDQDKKDESVPMQADDDDAVEY